MKKVELLKETNRRIFYAIYGEFDNVLNPLNLKPLSSIIDEDLIEVAKIINKDLENGEFIEIEDLCHKCVKYDNGQVLIYTDDLSFISYSRPIGGFIQSQSLTNQWISPLSILQSFDYLRSKGYALPWMGLSVEEMIEAGWIKLI